MSSKAARSSGYSNRNPAARVRSGMTPGWSATDRELAQVCSVLAAESLAGRYAALNLPVAIVAGIGDEVVDIGRHSRRLARELPRSTLHEVPEAGHMVHHTEPDRVGAVIQAITEKASATGIAGARKRRPVSDGSRAWNRSNPLGYARTLMHAPRSRSLNMS